MIVEYTEEIRKQILSYLDGWVVYSQNPTNNQDNTNVEPFITNVEEYKNNPNKRINDTELEKFFNSSYNKSLMICNRFNIDDLLETEAKFYLQGVCILTASDIWNKYNIRVNNEDLEDTYIQSYGGLLYKQAMTILKNFVNQRITGLHNFKSKNETNLTNNWIL